LTDWLSITPAVGLSFPARGLAQAHQQHMIVCHTPLSRHASKFRCTVVYDGKSLRTDAIGGPIEPCRKWN
jgi:hypothetical protein